MSSIILAYVDPSVISYIIQAVAGVLITLGAVAGVVISFLRKRARKLLALQQQEKKEVEEEIVIAEDGDK
ncbi:MAG: hypothetical protein E7047_01075 [Lentisphaerae bacterium]|nr:hypothetical protein [Lentisphaerota bacterium]